MLERLRLVAFRVAMQLQSSPLFIFSTRRIFLRLCGLKLERGVQVWHGVRIGTEKLVMAKGAGIAPGSHVGGAAHIFIGEDASIGPNVFITSSNHEIGPASRRLGDHFAKPILIERGAWIGANCTILPGVTIGEGCVSPRARSFIRTVLRTASTQAIPRDASALCLSRVSTQ